MLDIVEKKFIKFIKTHHAGQTVKKKVSLNKKKNTTLFIQLAKLAAVREWFQSSFLGGNKDRVQI